MINCLFKLAAASRGFACDSAGFFLTDSQSQIHDRQNADS